MAHWSLAQTTKAVEYFEQALAIAQESEKRRGEAITLNNLGLCYGDLGHTTQAVEYFEQAFSVGQSADNLYAQGLAVCNLGRAFVDENQLHEAAARLQEGIRIANEMNSPQLGGYSNGLMSLAYLYLNDLSTARSFAEATEQYDEPPNDHVWSAFLGTMTPRRTDP